MKKLLFIRSRTIAVSAVVLSVLLIGSGLLELRESRSDLFLQLRNQAETLASTVERSSRNVVLSTEQVEQQLTERLLNNAYFVARLDSEGRLNSTVLSTICRQNDIFRINVFDREGRRVMGSHDMRAEHAGRMEQMSPRMMLRPILEGSTDRLLIGLREARFGEGKRYAVAVKRTGRGGGAIALNLNVDDLSELRQSIGIGRLMKDLESNPGVEYAVLQDRSGIIAAGGRLGELSSLADDSVAASVLDRDTTLTRVHTAGGTNVFESLHPLRIDGGTLGVVRIGLSMELVDALDARMQRRVAVMTIIVLVLAVVAISLIVASQNYRLSQQRVRQVETFAGNILEQMRDAVVALDSKGMISVFNGRAEELFGIAASGALGKSAAALDDPRLAILPALFARTESSHEHKAMIGGEMRILSVLRSENSAADGTTESVTLVIRDRTEERALQAQLQHRNRLTAMGELAAAVAHEIRNPLNSIAMTAQRFAKEFRPARGVKEYNSLAGVIVGESRRVNGIIEQFLRFARPHAVRRQETDIREFISHIADTFKAEAKEAGIRFTSRAEGATTSIDPNLMTQVVLNILRNAREACSSGESIGLLCRMDGSDCAIEISDTGPGIAAENLEKIFDPAFTTKQGGTGLGLSIAREIVLAHGGTIDVQSAPGRGTTVRISVPSGGSAERTSA